MTYARAVKTGIEDAYFEEDSKILARVLLESEKDEAKRKCEVRRQETLEENLVANAKQESLQVASASTQAASASAKSG